MMKRTIALVILINGAADIYAWLAKEPVNLIVQEKVGVGRLAVSKACSAHWDVRLARVYAGALSLGKLQSHVPLL